MIDWDNIDTVLLDMDGTLLDLAFDNWFWQRHVPEQYALSRCLDYAGAARSPPGRKAEPGPESPLEVATKNHGERVSWRPPQK